MPRPKLIPTEEQRSTVKLLAAVGTPQDLIALKIGVKSPKTLRRHFRRELDFAAVEANASVAGALYKAAMSGDVDAIRFWLERRAPGWARPAFHQTAAAPPPFVVAFEEEPKQLPPVEAPEGGEPQ